MTTSEIDIVSVYHKDETFHLFQNMTAQAYLYEGDRVKVLGVDNRVDNRGFSRGCNYGATFGEAPVIGFINPDAVIEGPFVDRVLQALDNPAIVITGERFHKPQSELRIWGVRDWVCGACFFVKRDFFEERGGFDEGYVWGWEETDLIRQAQAEDLFVRSISLPIEHSSPSRNTLSEARYKQRHFDKGAERFRSKWT